jgi:hypothetical protein
MAKTPINCLDCGAVREVPNACLKLVKRCKPCQTKFNRNNARNRYRKLKGIPEDAPLKKKKAKVENPDQPVQGLCEDGSSGELLSPWGRVQPRSKPSKPAPVRTPEEEARRQEALTRLFDMLGDDSTTDDW